MQGYQNEEGYYSYGETDSTCGAEDGLYQPYEEPQDLQKPKKQGGMGAKLMKCVALGLTFGVVAATSFAGTNHFLRELPARIQLPATVKKCSPAEI